MIHFKENGVISEKGKITHILGMFFTNPFEINSMHGSKEKQT